jgi:hypothetical protein
VDGLRGDGADGSSDMPATVAERWLLLDMDERVLVLMMADELADGTLEGEGAWRRYQATVNILLPEVRVGEMSVDEVHAVAMHAATGRC